jgi:hypothetical protein
MSHDWQDLFGTIDVSTAGLRASGLKPVPPAPAAQAPVAAAPPAVAAKPATSQPAVQQQYPGVWTMAQTFTASASQFAASGGKTVSREVREERLAICKMCQQFDGTRCIQCGCFIAAKTWMPHEKCPAGKWPD